MKTLFSIIFSFFIAGAGIVLAMNAPQDDPACFEANHDGYTYDGEGTPPLPFNPDAPVLPDGITYEGEYEQPNGYSCIPSNSVCHWVYKPAQGTNPAEWVPCSGTLEKIDPEG